MMTGKGVMPRTSSVLKPSATGGAIDLGFVSDEWGFPCEDEHCMRLWAMIGL